MKRILLISSLAIVCSVGFAAPAHAQSPYGRITNWQYQYYSPYSTNTWANDWQAQYPAYSTYQSGLPNVVTSNRWGGNGQVQGLYTPTYVGGYRVMLVPYASPNSFAAPRYMYVPAPQR
jgi:hypothetical protein